MVMQIQMPLDIHAEVWYMSSSVAVRNFGQEILE